MTQRKATVDSVSVTQSTDFAIQIGRDAVAQALEFLADARRKDRLETLECRTCFYLRAGRIGGAAMTERPCGICDKSVLYSSTNTDKICAACAQKHQLCKHCGGDMLMRPRRKFTLDMCKP